MWYTGYVNINNWGYCPTSPEGHIRTPSYNYQLPNNLGNVGSNPQGNWRWCDLCMGLFTTLNSPSHCPANNGGRSSHRVGSGSFNYYLYHDTAIVIDPQSYWRWCGTCQGLYYQGPSGTQNGACPWDVKHTQGTGSFNYAIDWNGTY
jgi:hypothetical protein